MLLSSMLRPSDCLLLTYKKRGLSSWAGRCQHNSVGREAAMHQPVLTLALIEHVLQQLFVKLNCRRARAVAVLRWPICWPLWLDLERTEIPSALELQIVQ